MRKLAALLSVIGLVSASAAFAESKAAGGPDAPQASKAAVPNVSVPSASGRPEPKNGKAGDDFITLNFTNIEINALIKVMSELTQRNFILDEKVTGKITIMTPTKVSPDEAYQVFLSALEIKGFTAVEDGSVIRIIPLSMARQSGLKVFRDGDGGGEGFVTKLIRVQFANTQEITRIINPLISKDGSLIAYPSTNSVIITDSMHNIKKIESLLGALDVAAPEGKGRINVYYLKHANAEDIAKLMQALVARLPAPQTGAAAQQAATQPSTILEGAVTITADKATNSLIIVASTMDMELMKDVLQKLDIRRRQVYVETAIIEMSLAKQRDLGFEMQIPINQANFDAGKATAIGGTNFGGVGSAVVNGPAGLASMNGLAVGAVKGSFQFKGVEYLSVGALLRAVQTDSSVNVLSTPNILTTDNQKAEIMVGENIPFVGSQTQSAATGGNATYNIERKDVGITLKLTPQITSDDNVRLDIYQEISAVIETSGLNANMVGPSTSKRSASTTVVVKDRETMVIGGLIRDNVVSSTMKVPLLGDIPILGWLFKYKTSKVEKTNLMIFITPYIIKNETESEDLTRQKGEMLNEFRKEHFIEKKHHDLKLPLSRPAENKEAAGGAPDGPAQPRPEDKVPAETSLESSPTLSQPPRSVGAPQEGAR